MSSGSKSAIVFYLLYFQFHHCNYFENLVLVKLVGFGDMLNLEWEYYQRSQGVRDLTGPEGGVETTVESGGDRVTEWRQSGDRVGVGSGDSDV